MKTRKNNSVKSYHSYGESFDEVSPEKKAVIIGMYRQGNKPETIATVQHIPYTKVCAIIEARLDVCIEQLN